MVGGDRRELVVGVVGATLDVAPKGFGFVGVGVPKGPEGQVGYMRGCSGKLGKMGIKWGMLKSSEVVAKAATEFVGRASGLVVVSVTDRLRRLFDV